MENNYNNLLDDIRSSIFLNKHILLVGPYNEEKKHFITKKLVPEIDGWGAKAYYFEHGDHLHLLGPAPFSNFFEAFDDTEKRKTFVINDTEIFFDKYYLEYKYSEKIPYYDKDLVNKIMNWHKLYSEISNYGTTVHIVERKEEDEIEYLVKNLKKTEWNQKEAIVFRF